MSLPRVLSVWLAALAAAGLTPGLVAQDAPLSFEGQRHECADLVTADGLKTPLFQFLLLRPPGNRVTGGGASFGHRRATLIWEEEGHEIELAIVVTRDRWGRQIVIRDEVVQLNAGAVVVAKLVTWSDRPEIVQLRISSLAERSIKDLLLDLEEQSPGFVDESTAACLRASLTRFGYQ